MTLVDPLLRYVAVLIVPPEKCSIRVFPVKNEQNNPPRDNTFNLRDYVVLFHSCFPPAFQSLYTSGLLLSVGQKLACTHG